MSKAQTTNTGPAISLVTAAVCRVYIDVNDQAEIGGDIAFLPLKKSTLNKNLKLLRPHCADGSTLDTCDKVLVAGSKYFAAAPGGSDFVTLSEEGELLGEKWLPVAFRVPTSDISNEELMRLLRRTALVSSSSIPAASASSIHTKREYTSVETLRDECPWRRFPGSMDGKDQDKIYVAPADALNIPKSQQIFDRIPPAQILVTRALRYSRVSELGLNLRVKHCNEYWLDGTCPRGYDCFFIHAVSAKSGGWQQTSTTGTTITGNGSTASSPVNLLAAAGSNNSAAAKKNGGNGSVALGTGAAAAAAAASSSSLSTPASPADANSKKRAVAASAGPMFVANKKQQQQAPPLDVREGSIASDDLGRMDSNASSGMMGAPSGSSLGGTPISTGQWTKGAPNRQQRVPVAAHMPSLDDSVLSSMNQSTSSTPITSPPANNVVKVPKPKNQKVHEQQQQQQQPQQKEQQEYLEDQLTHNNNSKPVTFMEAILCRICHREIHEGEVQISSLNGSDIPYLRSHPAFSEQARHFPTWTDISNYLETGGYIEIDNNGKIVTGTTAAIILIKKVYKRLGIKMAEINTEPCSMSALAQFMLSGPTGAAKNDDDDSIVGRQGMGNNNNNGRNQQQHHLDVNFAAAFETDQLRQDSDLIFDANAAATAAAVDSDLLLSFAPPPPRSNGGGAPAVVVVGKSKQQQQQDNYGGSSDTSRTVELQQQLTQERKQFDAEQQRAAKIADEATRSIMRLRNENEELKHALQVRDEEIKKLNEAVEALKHQAVLKEKLVNERITQAQAALDSAKTALQKK